MTSALAGDAVALHDAPRPEACGHRVMTDPDTDRLWKEIFEQGHAVAAAAQVPEQDERPGMHPDGHASAARTPLAAPQPLASSHAPSLDGARHPGKGVTEAEERDRRAEVYCDVSGGSLAAQQLALAQTGDAHIHAAPEGAPTHFQRTSPTVVPGMPSPSPAAFGAPRAATFLAGGLMPTGVLAASRGVNAEPSEPAPQSGMQRFGAPAPLADEAVQIYHRDGVVAITIRDLALQPANALRCAFEAARQLFGDTRALKQVTLNGKSIYEVRAAANPADDASPHPRVSFTC